MSTYNPKQPNKHLGTDKYITFFVTRNRPPSGADVRQPETGTYYSIGTVWQVGANPTSGTQGALYMLSKIVANVSYWLPIFSSTSLSIDVKNFGVSGTYTPSVGLIFAVIDCVGAGGGGG